MAAKIAELKREINLLQIQMANNIKVMNDKMTAMFSQLKKEEDIRTEKREKLEKEE